MKSILSHFLGIQTREKNLELTPFIKELHERLDASSFLYQVFPAREDIDYLIWTSIPLKEKKDIAHFMQKYQEIFKEILGSPLVSKIFWGYTKPSIYAKGKSIQEIDPLKAPRKPYLVVYPFIKTPQWYLLSQDTRQGMMNEHIKIGRRYPQILQLLLYSFGIQDQEFVVVYEMEDLVEFSDLVYSLRGSQVREYTMRDTPIISAFYQEGFLLT